MNEPSLAPGQGRIYDLGYQPYDGPRLGRSHAVMALLRAGLRRAWGLGRPFRAKVAPWLLFGLALLPALAGLAIAVLVSDRFSPFRYENYYNNISRILVLFCTAVAPELVCPDQRGRVLTLYFSRAVGRLDYVFARLGALLAALLLVALTPQALLFLGNAFASKDTLGYARDNAGQIPRILAAGALVSVYFGTIALAVAAYTTRRVIAAGAFFALMVISSVVAGLVHGTLQNDGSRSLGLLGLSEAPIAATAWIFGADAPPGLAANVNLPLGLWALATVAYTAIALLLLLRRYLRLTP